MCRSLHGIVIAVVRIDARIVHDLTELRIHGLIRTYVAQHIPDIGDIIPVRASTVLAPSRASKLGTFHLIVAAICLVDEAFLAMTRIDGCEIAPGGCDTRVIEVRRTLAHGDRVTSLCGVEGIIAETPVLVETIDEIDRMALSIVHADVLVDATPRSLAIVT
ncbi:MAG: hypothetical protein AABY13_02920 [Nanoarchaeota archaeon]